MTNYVCGFAFNLDAGLVALIRKTKPTWQAGRLNGIGGHVEPGENPDEAMEREFEEEAGVRVTSWDHFLVLMDGSDRWNVHFYRAFDAPIHQVCSKTDEHVGLYTMINMPRNKVVPNLRWLLPLAADRNWWASKLELYNVSGVEG